MCLWASRFVIQWPWYGFIEGLHLEDWRYVDIAKKVGAGSFLHWFGASLFGFHIIPTLNVFFGLAPAQKIMSTRDDRPLNEYDVLAFAFTLGAIIIEWTADYQLSAFR